MKYLYMVLLSLSFTVLYGQPNDKNYIRYISGENAGEIDIKSIARNNVTNVTYVLVDDNSNSTFYVSLPDLNQNSGFYTNLSNLTYGGFSWAYQRISKTEGSVLFRLNADPSTLPGAVSVIENQILLSDRYGVNIANIGGSPGFEYCQRMKKFGFVPNNLNFTQFTDNWASITIAKCSSGWNFASATTKTAAEIGGHYEVLGDIDDLNYRYGRGACSCSGAVTQSTVYIDILVITPDKSPSAINSNAIGLRYTNNSCVTAADPKVFNGYNEYFSNILDVSTDRGNIFEPSDETIDISAYGGGTCQVDLLWNIPTDYKFWGGTAYTGKNSWNVCTLYALPTIVAPTSFDVCDDSGSILLPSASPSGGSWSGGFISGGYFNSNVAPVGNVTANYFYTDGNGCVGSSAMIIQNNALPAVTVTSNPTICYGSSVSLTGNGASTYTWSPATGLSATSGKTVTASPTSTTLYTITGTDSKGCSYSTNTTVTVIPQVTATASVAAANVCKGTQTTLGVNGGSGSYSYSWSPSSKVSNPFIVNPTTNITSTTTFTLVATDGSGCTRSSTIDVIVNSLPAVDAGNDIGICIGTAGVLNGAITGAGTITYAWSGPNMSATNIANPTVNPSSTATYTLVGTDGNGCQATDNVTVTVRSAQANAGIDKNICAGQSVQLSATGGVTYSWLPVAGLSDASVSSPVATPAATTDYTVTVTDNFGCMATDVVRVNVNGVPVIGLTADSSICKGSSIQLTASGAISYSWSPSTGLSNANISNPIASPSNTTVYTVTGSNGANCTSTKQVIVTVNDLPTADAGNDVQMCIGTGITLSGSATGSGTLSYLWSGPAPITGGTTLTPTVNPSSTSNYTLTVTDANGCQKSDVVKVTVTSSNANAGIDKSICVGQSVGLSATGGISYSWVRQGGGATGLNDDGISAPLFTGSAAGTVTLIVTVVDNNGCQSSDAINIFVNAPPALSLNTSSVNLCKGSSTQFVASTAGIVSYSWSPSTGLSASNIYNPTASPNNTTLYTCRAYNASGCYTEQQVTVYVNSIPVADAGSNKSLCFGSSTTITANATGTGPFTYSWAGPSITGGATTQTATVAPTSTSNYVVTVTDANGCVDTDDVTVSVIVVNAEAGVNKSVCVGSTVQLSASGGVSYLWSNQAGGATGLNDSTISSPTYLGATAGVVTLIATVTDNNGCQATDNVSITTVAVPVLAVSGTQSICKGSSVQLSATGANTYSWSPSVGLSASNISNPIASPTSTTVYTVTGTNASGCSSTAQIQVNVNDLPKVNAGSDKILCSGSTIDITAIPTGTGPFTYVWTGGSISAGGSTVTATLDPVVTTTYTVTVTDANGCTANDQVKITVTSATANAGVDKVICEGQSIVLGASGGVAYTWTRVGGGATNLSDNSVSSPTFLTATAGAYDLNVTVTDGNGCQASDIVRVTVNANPVITTVADQYLCKGSGVILSTSGASSYTWSPSVGLNSSVIASPTATPNATTVYTVRGYNASGCYSEKQVIVFVRELPKADAGSDTETCEGVAKVLNGSGSLGTGPYTFNWAGPGTILNGNTATPTVTITANSTFTLTVTDANGCTDTDQVNVRVNTANANAGTNKLICEAGSVQLSASGGISFLWSPSTGLNDNTVSNPIASPATTTTYTVTVTDNNGCIDTDDVIVTVQPLPTSSVSGDVAICRGTPTTLTATGGSSYQWSPSTGLNVTNLASVSANPSNSTIYTVMVYNAAGCYNTHQVVVTVKDNPVANAGQDKVVCSGVNLPLSGSATGTGPFSYSWSGTGIVGASNTQGIVVNVTSDQTYTLTVTDALGCSATDQVLVKVNSLPNAYISIDDFITTYAEICVGTSVQLKAFGGVDYAWSGDPGISNPAIASPTVTVNSDMNLSVVVTNSNGCTRTANLQVVAVNNPVVDAGPILTLCIDDDPYDLRSDVNVQGGTFTGTGIVNNVLFDPADAGVGVWFINYNVSVGGCSGSDVREVRVKAKPTITVTGSNLICPGDTIQLSASGALNYSWTGERLKTNTGATVKVYPNRTTTYTVVGTDQYGCDNYKNFVVEVNTLKANAGTNKTICQGSSIQLSGSSSKSNSTYVWTPSASLNDANVPNPIATPSVTTTYVLTITDQEGCSVKDDVEIVVETKPTLSVGGILELCSTDLVGYDLRNDVSIPGGVFSSQSGGLDGVSFYPSEASVGIQFVTYTVNVGACTLVGTREIRVLAEPVVSVNQSAFTICSGSSAQLTISGGISFNYFPETGVSNPNIGNPILSPVVTTDYLIEVIDTKGCSKFIDVRVNVTNVAAEAGGDKTICEGEFVQLSATGGKFYSWSPSGTLSNNNINNPIASPTSTTVYTVTATDANGCVATDFMTVYVNDAPDLTVGSKLTLCSNDTQAYDLRADVNLSNPTFASTSNGLNGVQFEPWKVSAGIYFVDVTVVSGGCTIKGRREIEVVAPKQVTLEKTLIKVCKGATVQLSASNGVSYSWSPNLNISSTSVFNPFVTVDETTVYTVTGYDLKGCPTTKSVTVEVETSVVNAGLDVTICEGDGVTLNGTGVAGYTWNNSSSLSNGSVSNPVATPNSTTTYTLTGVSANGCVSTDQVVVTVKPRPILSLGGQVVVCKDDSPIDVRNYANISGGTWTGPSALTGVLFDPSKATGIVFLNYTVSVNGCSASAQKEIKILPAPTVSIIEDQEICSGGSVQLSASGGISYEWFPKTNINDPYIFSPTVNPSTTTIYTVAVSDVNGCKGTKPVEVKVNSIAATITQNVTICRGENVQLLATGGKTYLWNNGNSLSNPKIANPVASPSVTTSYLVTITDSKGCYTTQTVTVTVDDAPTLSVGSTLTMCKSSDSPYDLRSDVTVLGGTFTSSSSGLVGVQFDPSKVSPGIYFVTYTVAIGNCSVSAVREIDVIGDPVITGLSSYDICKGESVQLVVSGAASYSWTPTTGVVGNLTATPVVTPSVTTTYTVTGVNSNGCKSTKQIVVDVLDKKVNAGVDVKVCYGQSVQLTASGVTAYSWDNASSLNDSEINNPLASPSVTTTYTVTGYNTRGCVSTDKVVVTVEDYPSLSVGARVDVCKDGGIVDVRNYANLPGGTWSGPSALNGVLFDPSKATGVVFLNYSLTLNGCTSVVQKEINILAAPTVTISDSKKICKGSSIQLSSGGGVSYSWSPTAGISDPNVFNPIVTPTETTDYTVTITDNNGCKNSKSVNVEVVELLTTITPNTTICRGETIELEATGGRSYLWNNIGSLNDPRSAKVYASPTGTTNYDVVISDKYGCSVTESVTVTVNDAPPVSVGNPLKLCKTDNAYDLRKDVSVSGGLFSSTSGGLSGVLFDPTKVNPGIYFVDYTVVISNCSVKATREIQVEGPPTVFLQATSVDICKGDNVKLEVFGGSTYSWFPTVGLSSSSIANPIASPTTTTTYEVTVASALGCTIVNQVKVNVNTLNADAGRNIILCSGESTKLDATGGDYYEWDYAAELVGAFVRNPTVSPSSSKYYFVNISSSDGCVYRDSVFVNVIQPSTLTAGAKLYLCYNDINGYDLRQDVNVAGGTFSSTSKGLNGVKFDPISSSGPGVYFVEYSVSIGGCLREVTREIEVLAGPTIVLDKSSYEICKGDSVELKVNGGATYSWFPIVGLSSSSIANPMASPTSTTTYEVTVASALGCTVVKQVIVNVNTLNADAGRNIFLCSGESVKLDATGGDYYEWDYAAELVGGFVRNPTVSPSVSKYYYVNIGSSDGCILRDSVFVNVIQPSALTAGPKLFLCYNDINGYDLRQDVNVAGGTFTSTSKGLNGIKFDPVSSSGPGVYFVKYSVSISGCLREVTREIEVLGGATILSDKSTYEVCKGAGGVILAMSSSKYDSVKWSPSLGLSSTTVLQPIANPSINTTYTLTVYSGKGCATKKDVPVVVNEYVLPRKDNQSICKGQGNIDLGKISSGVWNGRYVVDNRFYPDSVGDYWLQVVDTNIKGCVGRDSIRVTVNDVPVIGFKNGTIVRVCQNSDITDLNEYVDFVGAEWISTYSTSTGLFDPSKSGAGTFLVKVDAENRLGCVTTDYMTVKVSRLPSVYSGPDIEVCFSNDTLDISKLAQPSGGSFFGTGIVQGKYFLPSSAGQGKHEIVYTYYDAVSKCDNTDARTITVLKQSPVFAGPPLSLCIDSEPIELTESVSPKGGVFYASKGVNGTKFFPSAGVGTYNIDYTITDANSCLATARRVITVNARPQLKIDPEIVACKNLGIIDLTTHVNIPSGKWTGSKGITNGLLKTDSLATGKTVLTYEVTTPDGCDLVGQMVVDIQEVAKINVGSAINTCKGGFKIDLLEGQNKEFVKVSGKGVDSLGVFDPAKVNGGTQLVTYEFVNPNGCVSVQTRSIFVQGEVYVNAGDDFVICQNIGKVDLSGVPTGGFWSGPGVLTNRFDPLSVALGEHQLFYTVDLGYGCTNTDTVSVHVNSSSITNFGRDTLVCLNTSEILLNFSPALAQGKWVGKGVVNNIFYPSQAGVGSWTLSYSNSNFDCAIAGQRTFNVIGVPEKAVTDNYTVSGCVGDVIRLSASVPSGSAQQINYLWFYENEDEPFEIGKNIDFEIRETENIYFTSVNQFGCSPSEIDFLRVRANGPVGQMSVSSDSIAIGELVKFSVASSNTTGFYWQFGDGNYSYDENPNYYYYSTGFHDIALVLTSADGCDLRLSKDSWVYVYDPAKAVNDTTSVLGFDFLDSVYVKTNPVYDGTLTVNSGERGSHVLQIYSIDGNQAMKGYLYRGENKYNVSALPSGVYIVKLVGRFGVYSHKIVISHGK